MFTELPWALGKEKKKGVGEHTKKGEENPYLSSLGLSLLVSEMD